MRIALVGYGRMGREVEALAPELGHEIVARIDAGDTLDADALAGAEAAVEFSLPEAAADNLVRLSGLGIDAACGTTGWFHGDAGERVRQAATEAGSGVIWAPNFSLGVALFTRLVERAAALADALPQYDPHLHEAHHRHKADAPSGTARFLADQLVAGLERVRGWSMDVPADAPRDPATLGVSVTRAGEIPGTHTVSFEGPHDRIVLTHEARSRGGFARGALEALAWVRGRRGLYTLDDWLEDRFGE
jgi:4-hydroxy-tetrahydrodipicolinate reductase